MGKYTGLIPQNTALPDAKEIAVYHPDGRKAGRIALGGLTAPDRGEKLYSFGALSDIHYQYDTAPEDFHRALTYLNEQEDVAFICICGDLTSGGTAEELTAYKNAVDTYSPDTPVYAMMGNHDVRAGLMNDIHNYTGHPNYFTVSHGNDVFIFVGNVADWTTDVLSTEELQWLYETLEANRNKRCFLFQHIRPTDGCGNALGLYKRSGTVDWGGTCGTVFESLLSHYPNVVFFHGHSHLKFYLQEHDKLANYDQIRGCHSVHIPSLAVPRDSDWAVNPSTVDVYAASEGYVVDVYENGIHLRGRDFVKGEFIPVASYWLDTVDRTAEAGTYTDDTGTVGNMELNYRLHGDKSNYIVDGPLEGSTSGVVAPVDYIDGVYVWEINEDAFRNNANVRVVILPKTVGYLTAYCFAGCTNLETVTFKRTLADGSFNLSYIAFKDCPNLKSIYVPWAEGEVSGAPWGAEYATIYYNTGT